MLEMLPKELQTFYKASELFQSLGNIYENIKGTFINIPMFLEYLKKNKKYAIGLSKYFQTLEIFTKGCISQRASKFIFRPLRIFYMVHYTYN